MKILKCKRSGIYDIGFIDPYYIHEETVQKYANDTENNLVLSCTHSFLLTEC